MTCFLIDVSFVKEKSVSSLIKNKTSIHFHHLKAVLLYFVEFALQSHRNAPRPASRNQVLVRL